MTNSNEHKSYGREVRQETYNDADGQTHTDVTQTTETVSKSSNPNSYQDGYVKGRVSERRHQEEGLAERDNDNAARGLLLGILLTALVGLTAGGIWFFNQRNEAPAVAPVVVPVPDKKPDPKPSAQASQAPEKQTTIIEKTREVLVPVPQQQVSPAPQAPPSTPSPASQPPAGLQSPATQPQSPTSSTPEGTQSDTSTGTTTPEGTQSNTNTTTPEGTSSPMDTTSGSSSSPAGEGKE